LNEHPDVDVSDVRYARSGDVSIAYQVVGNDRPDLVFVRGFSSNLLTSWQQPLLVRHFVDLASNGRMLLFDKRGTGLSDRVAGVPTLEARTDDVRAVMDAEGTDQAILWSGLEGTQVSTLFAATYPDRCLGLVVLNPQVRGLRSPEYPWAPTESEWRERLADVRANWGTREYFLRLLRDRAPSLAGDPSFRSWYVDDMRQSLSPGAAATYVRTLMESDVSEVLGAVRVPTLLLYSPPYRGPATYFAERVANARMHELTAMIGDYTWIDDATHQETQVEVRNFISSLHRQEEPDRILATLLFTDIVNSTAKQASLGDRGWKGLIEQHNAAVRDCLARWRGVEHDTAGDGFYATFDGPARAIHCAQEIRAHVRDLGIEVRAGIHTGECELVGGKPAGLTVSIGARVAANAAASEVMISQTVKDLVAGSGLSFQDAGEHELKGVPDVWRLYRVVT
jgi:class 3 adenylate cyclase